MPAWMHAHLQLQQGALYETGLRVVFLLAELGLESHPLFSQQTQNLLLRRQQQLRVCAQMHICNKWRKVSNKTLSNEYHKSLMQTAKCLTSKMNGLFHLHPLTAGKSHQRSFLSPHQTHSDDVTGHVLMRLHWNHTERWQDKLQWQQWTNCNVLTELRHFYIPGADLNKITDFFFSTSWC